MKCNNYIPNRLSALALALIVRFLAQANTSYGLDCYQCVFIQSNATLLGKNSSATCEKNPTAAELRPVNVTRESLLSSAAVHEGLKGIRMDVSQEVNPYLLSFLTAASNSNNPSSISSTNQRNPDNSVVVTDGILETETNGTSWLYCSVSTFKIPGYGRIVLRSFVETEKDKGETYCDTSLPPGTDFDFLSPRNESTCICRASGCNGKDFNAGADKSGQSIAFLVFSIGLAVLALISFGQ